MGAACCPGASGSDTLITAAFPRAIRIPGDLQGPPYILDTAGAYYLLTQDVRADGSAFEIAADGITLDLDGHTVVFGDDGPAHRGQYLCAAGRTPLRGARESYPESRAAAARGSDAGRECVP